MFTLTYIIIASLLISLVSFIGAIFLISQKFGSEKFLTYAISFAAGIMLSTAFLDLMPEALSVSPDNNSIFVSALLGIIVFFFLEKFIIWFHHHDKPHHAQPISLLILLGDGFHNFFDGLAIAAAFLTGTDIGIITTLAITAHEVPHEISDLSILLYSGLPRWKALLYNFASALTAMIGAIGGYYFLDKINNIQYLFLSFTAGNFIYIACSDLIPSINKNIKQKKSWTITVPFLLGLLTASFLVRFIGI